MFRNGHVAGFALGLAKGQNVKNIYLPIGHLEGSENLDKDQVTSYVREICALNIPKIFHNSLYDLGWLSSLDIKVEGRIIDTMYAAALLDENRYSFGLDILGKEWLGEGKDEEELVKAANILGYGKDIKGSMWKMPPRYVGAYAEQDAGVTHKLWEYEQARLVKEDLTDLMDLEMSLVPLLLEQRRRGVRVDVDRAEQLRNEMKRKKEDLLEEVYHKFGGRCDPYNAKQIARICDKQNIPYSRTPTGLPSFTKEWLETHPHEFPRMIREARKIDKTISTFFEGMILDHVHKGRIHAEAHPLKSDDGGTVSGRFSYSNPNLQQTTARDPVYGPMVRSLFLPEDGCLWGALDYSSQEPRLTVHYAYLTKQRGAAEAVAAFKENPRLDYHQMVADLAGIERGHAKIINLALAYGMGQVKLCLDLGLPLETLEDGRQIAGPEGRALLDKYHECVPFVKGLMSKCTRIAADRGYVRTLLGRRCRFDSWEPTMGRKPAVRGRAAASNAFDGPIKRAFTHKALNRLIQGSAADMTKKAMQGLWAEGVVPMISMHDELDISVPDETHGRKCVEIMEHCVEISVPQVIDAEFGFNWGNAKKVFSDRPWTGGLDSGHAIQSTESEYVPAE